MENKTTNNMNWQSYNSVLFMNTWGSETVLDRTGTEEKYDLKIRDKLKNILKIRLPTRHLKQNSSWLRAYHHFHHVLPLGLSAKSSRCEIKSGQLASIYYTWVNSNSWAYLEKKHNINFLINAVKIFSENIRMKLMFLRKSHHPGS